MFSPRAETYSNIAIGHLSPSRKNAAEEAEKYRRTKELEKCSPAAAAKGQSPQVELARGSFYAGFCAGNCVESAGDFRSLPQKGQNLSVSASSCLHCGQEGCRLHLQLGQKLKRAPTLFPHCGQG